MLMSKRIKLVSNSKLPFNTVQFPLLLKLIKWYSKDTRMVSLPMDVEASSIMVSSLSDMEDQEQKNTSLSKNHGVLAVGYGGS